MNEALDLAPAPARRDQCSNPLARRSAQRAGLRSPMTSASTRPRSTSYVRRGESGNLRALETRRCRSAPIRTAATRCRSRSRRRSAARLAVISPIRSIAGVREISGNVYKKPFMTAGPAVGWVGETDARTQTDSPTLDSNSRFRRWSSTPCRPRPRRCSRTPPSTSTSGSPARSSRCSPQQEGAAFVNGDGTNKPKGFLQYTTVAECLLGLDQDRLRRDRRRRRVRRRRADRCAHRSRLCAEGRLPPERRLRDEPQDAGRGAQAEGRRRAVSLAAADPGRTAAPACSPTRWSRPRTCRTSRRTRYAIAFGDFRRGYLVVDRQGVRVLRDPFTAKPYVLFYTTKRVGGGVQDFDAIKLLKFAAS